MSRPTIEIVTRDGEGQTIQATVGHSVMELIRTAGIDELAAICGGCCSCATCHVYVDDPWLGRLPEIGDDENDLLEDSAHRRPNSRLACQIQFVESLNELRVTIAPEE